MASERERIAYELCRAVPGLANLDSMAAVDVVQRIKAAAERQGMETAAEICGDSLTEAACLIPAQVVAAERAVKAIRAAAAKLAPESGTARTEQKP